MHILALDQALVTSGYAAIDTDRAEVTYGEIKSPKRTGKIEHDYWQRVKFVRDSAHELIRKNKSEVLVLEKPFVSSRQHVSSGQQLQAVYTSMRLLGLDLGLEVWEIAPTQWPRLIGYSSTKGELFEDLKDYGVTSDHQSDAIGLGLSYLAQDRTDWDKIERHHFTYKLGLLYRLGKLL